MRLGIFRAVARNRHVRTMIFLIVLFTSMLVPFYSLTGHFKFVEETASKYIQVKDVYLVLDIGNKSIALDGENHVYVSIKPATLRIDDRDMEVVSYSFTDPNIASNLLNIDIPELDLDESILGDFIAEEVGVDIGDYINLSINGVENRYRVVGFNRYFPVIVPYTPSLEPDGLIINGSVSPLQNTFSNPPFIYRLGSYMGLVDELRRESIKILGIWSVPLYAVVLVGVAIVSARFLYSIRNDLDILYALGYSRSRVTIYIMASLAPLIVIASFVGVCLGIVLSQVSAKLLYIALGRVVIYPVLGLWEYFTILVAVSVASSVGVLSSFMWSGICHGKAD